MIDPRNCERSTYQQSPPLGQSAKPDAPLNPSYVLLERNDQLRRMTAPVDRYDERTRPWYRRQLVTLAGKHARHRDHELVAEIPPRIAGDGVRDLADEIAHVL